MAVLAIDWDNTLMSGDEWLPGAQDALKRFKEEGHKIIIHSCNSPTWVAHHLEEAGIRVDYIWVGNSDLSGKPLADLYIDDKGYHHPHNTPWDEEALSKVLDRVKGLDNRKW